MKAGNAKNSVASVCVSNYNKLGAVFIFVKEGKIMQEKEKGGFSFINEQIKEKPLNKKRLVKKALFTVALAVIFGAVAALVFSLLQPEFSNWFYPEEKPVVTIPQDDVTETEEPSQGDIQEASEQKDTQETAMPVPIELIVYKSCPHKHKSRDTASSRTKNSMSVRFVHSKRLTSIEITFDRFRKVKYSYPGHRA